LFLAHAFLDGLGSGLDQVLGLLQAQARDRADFLDDVDLLVTGGSEDDVEFRLLLGRGGLAATGAGRGDSHGSRGGNAPLLLEKLRQIGRLEDGQAGELLRDFFDISHVFTSLTLIVGLNPGFSVCGTRYAASPFSAFAAMTRATWPPGALSTRAILLAGA